jgi:hypothetical protein
MRVTTGRGSAALLLAAGAVLGCSRNEVPVQDSIVEAEGLSATMGVETGADLVRLTLHVTNTSGAPIDLEFTSGQRYDFQIAEVDGDLVGETLWTWSMDKSFMQALGTETLEPGGSLRFTEEWPAGGRRGELVGIGRLTSSSHPLQQSVRFELAGDE